MCAATGIEPRPPKSQRKQDTLPPCGCVFGAMRCDERRRYNEERSRASRPARQTAAMSALSETCAVKTGCARASTSIHAFDHRASTANVHPAPPPEKWLKLNWNPLLRIQPARPVVKPPRRFISCAYRKKIVNIRAETAQIPQILEECAHNNANRFEFSMSAFPKFYVWRAR